MHHGAGLRRALIEAGRASSHAKDTLKAIVTDYRHAKLDPQNRAMLDYVVKVTRAPGRVTVDDIDGLRHAGFDDRAIHDICTITAYYAFVNRIADGLGVELEPGRARGANDHRQGDQ